MLRMGCIGVGATLLMSAVVNFIAIEQLFDETVERELGMTAADMRGLYYVLGGFGLGFVLLGAFCPLPKPVARKPLPPPLPRR